MGAYAWWSSWWQMLLLASMISIVTSAVHADHPLASNRFWRSQSIHRHALLMAKVGFAAVVGAGIPVVAQFLTLMSLGLPVLASLHQLPGPALLSLTLAVGALPLAALTTRLRSVVFISMGLLTLRGLAASNLVADNVHAALEALRRSAAVQWAIIPALLAVFAWNYLSERRSAAFTRAMTAGVLVACSLIWSPGRLFPARQQGPLLVARIDSTTVQRPLRLRNATYRAGSVRLLLETPAPQQGKRLVLVKASLRVYFSDNTVDTLRIHESEAARVFRTLTVTELSQSTSAEPVYVLPVVAPIGWTGNAPFASTPVRVALDALVEEQSYHVRLDEPLRVGANVALGNANHRVSMIVSTGPRPVAHVDHVYLPRRRVIAEVYGLVVGNFSRLPTGAVGLAGTIDTAVLADGETEFAIGSTDALQPTAHAALQEEAMATQLILPTRDLTRITHAIALNAATPVIAQRLVVGEWKFRSLAPGHAEIVFSPPPPSLYRPPSRVP